VAWFRRTSKRDISTLDQYIALINSFQFEGNGYALTGQNVTQTLNGSPAERIANNMQAYAQAAYMANGPVFACMAVRQLLFSAIDFRWQDRSTRNLFGNNDLSIFEKPWVGGTTQDMLIRMIQDADLAGNSYWTIIDGDVVRLRPDWVTIAMVPRIKMMPEEIPGSNGRIRQVPGIVGYKKIGYQYEEGGIGNCKQPVQFLANEVAHFAPYPDPLATYRGMSWLTPIIREIQTDGQMNHHKSKFFENAATPNLVVRVPPEVGIDAFKLFKAEMDKEHRGGDNAYKPLYLGGGADVAAQGLDFEQMTFKVVQGAGETRIAAAAGVPPIIAGFSEGLESATYSNYAQARRRFADGTMHPLWQNAAGSLAILRTEPNGARLWYDARHVPFLREDAADAADIERVKGSTIRNYTDAGFTPESAVAAVDSEDITKLVHTGYFSVQLWPPGQFQGPPNPPTQDTTPPAKKVPPAPTTKPKA
jgi:hypothetical protein